MEDDFSPDASAAFDKLAALKRRYQSEADPVADVEPAPEDENAFDNDDIPVLTEAVLIAEPPLGNPPASEQPIPNTGFLEAQLVDLVIERLRPELHKLLEAAVIGVLHDRAPVVYEAWLDGLRQRTRQAVNEIKTEARADD